MPAPVVIRPRKPSLTPSVPTAPCKRCGTVADIGRCCHRCGNFMESPKPHAERIAEAMGEIGEVLLRHNLAIFFADKPGLLYADGKPYGTIDHREGDCGHTFTIVPNKEG